MRTLLLIIILFQLFSEEGVDSDGDGLPDSWEQTYFKTLKFSGEDDNDGDGLTNFEEFQLGTNPLKTDTDNDGLSDFEEVKNPFPQLVTDPLNPDSDEDFLSDYEEVKIYKTLPNQADSDNDSLSDFVEIKKYGTNPNYADTDGGFTDDGKEILIDHTDPKNPADDTQDSDGDGLSDYNELNQYGTNRLLLDTDFDGLSDGDEISKGTDPLNPDTDGDGLNDGAEVSYFKTNPLVTDTDGDGLSDKNEVTIYFTDPLNTDTDYDTLNDGLEVSKGMNPLLPDSDGGGVLDPVEVWQNLDPVNPDDEKNIDSDGDGLSDEYEKQVSKTNPDLADTDGDNLSDSEEVFPLKDHLVTDPLDADTDDDGILDGNEGGIFYPDKIEGGTLPTKFDTDEDGLSDGVEKGLSAPQESSIEEHKNDTDLSKFKKDEDPVHNTDPLKKDTDGDGLIDGKEDKNKNGKWDSSIGDQYFPDGETNPLSPDSDGDGINDDFEVKYSDPDVGEGEPLNPLDPDDKLEDPDGDGLSNYQEYKLFKIDSSGKVVPNSTNPRKADSDDDGLKDGVEVSSNYGNKSSDPNNPDSDSDGILDGVEDKNKDGFLDEGEENPISKDTDGDGLADGVEDSNLNGKVDEYETDPTKKDTDGDDILDGEELFFYGTDPKNSDTDQDGLSDGLEIGRDGDADPNSKTNPLKTDTDGDGLWDSTEDKNKNGKKDENETDPVLADTDGDNLIDGLELGVYNDSDPSTKTDPLNPDTDSDLLIDSVEDKNHNGKKDDDETDPLKADTDGGGVSDGKEVLIDGTDPLNPNDDATKDYDEDGLLNGVEYQIGTKYDDPDTDSDTIKDGDEAGDSLNPIDCDDDGIINPLDEDSDNDSIPDSVEAGDDDLNTKPFDNDKDGIFNFCDTDSDNDEIPDKIEWNVDIDGDGEADVDVDGDGIYNFLDEDSDGDLKPDIEEGTGDVDGDGIMNFVDANDSDGPLAEKAEKVETVESAEKVEDVYEQPEVVEFDSFESPEINDTVKGEEILKFENQPENLDVLETPDVINKDLLKEEKSDGLNKKPDEKSPETVEYPEGKIQGGVVCSFSNHADLRIVTFLMLLFLFYFTIRFITGKRKNKNSRNHWLILMAFVLTSSFFRIPSTIHAQKLIKQVKIKGIKPGFYTLPYSDAGILFDLFYYEGGLSFMYLKEPLVRVKDKKILKKIIDYRYEGNFFGTFGVASFFNLSFFVPMTFYQKTNLENDENSLARKYGIGDITLYPRLKIFDEDSFAKVNLVIAGSFTFPTGDSNSHTGTNNYEIIGKLIASRHRGSALVTMNFWYRYLKYPVKYQNITDDDQAGISLGIAYLKPGNNFKFAVDSFIAVPVKRPFFNKEEIFSEASVSMGYNINGVAVEVGYAHGLAPGFGIPKYRIFLNVSYLGNETDEEEHGIRHDRGQYFPVSAFEKYNLKKRTAKFEYPYKHAEGLRKFNAKKIVGVTEEKTTPQKPEAVKTEKPQKKQPKITVIEKKQNITIKKIKKEFYFPQKILFSKGKYKINPAYYGILNTIIKKLHNIKNIKKIIVEGHSSLVGRFDFNIALSVKRAESVKKYLVSHGIAEELIETIGYGPKKPIIPNISEEANAINQRVEIKVITE